MRPELAFARRGEMRQLVETEQAHAAVEHHEFAQCRIADGDIEIDRARIRHFQMVIDKYLAAEG